MGPAQIPVLDTLVLDQKNGRQLLEAVSQWGFVFIRNQGTGFGPDLLDQTFYLAHKFFASPREEKAKYAITANVKTPCMPQFS